MDIEKRNDGCIRFTDTSGITYSMYEGMTKSLSLTRYPVADADALKRNLDKQDYLTREESLVILGYLGSCHQSRYTKDRISKDNELARDYFGVTDDPELAGYLLTDGDMLDLSYEGYMRDRDHRDIDEVISVDGNSYSAGLIQFVSYGNIRLLNRDGFELCKKPTDRQKTVLAHFIRHNPSLYVDISNTDGDVVRHLTYSYAMPGDVFRDIDEYFALFAA